MLCLLLYVNLPSVIMSNAYENRYVSNPLRVTHISIFVSIAHNDTMSKTSSPPAICVISRFSTKSIVFPKYF